MGLNVPAEQLAETKQLVKEGDFDLAQYRDKFKKKQGRETKLDDDKIIEAIAALSDDDDDEFVQHVLVLEAEAASSA